MKRFETYAKANLTHEQICAKTAAGCDGIEIQLLGEMLGASGGHDWWTTVFDDELMSFVRYPIKVIHAPIIPGHGDTTLERLVDDTDFELIDGVFRLGDFFGRWHREMVTVVFHTEMYPELMQDLGSLWDRLVASLGTLLGRYRFVRLAIENVSPLRGIGSGGELHLANNFAFDNIEMVKQLRRELDTQRIGTCLDTCHAFLTEKYIGGLYEMLGDRQAPDLSLEEFYRRNQEYLFLMHVSDISGSGYGKGRHGVPFNEHSYGKLACVMCLHDQYAMHVPITLEVEEEDYLEPEGYKLTARMIRRYYEQGR